MNKTKYLQQIYFDSSHPAAYSSEEKLYRRVKEEGKYKIPRAEIKKWLQSQEAYSVHKQSQGKFARRSVIATYKHYQWDIDTAVLESYKSENDGYAYFVLAIDIFSRFVWTFPLKTRKGTEMAKALSEIFKTAGQTPHNIRTDKGTEYLNSNVKELLKRKKVKHFVSQNSVKACYAERAIKTIRKKIARLLTRNKTHRWKDELVNITQSYNSTYHRGIGKTPKSVTNDDRYRFWHLQRRNAKNPSTAAAFKYLIGDAVRISHLRDLFRREYDERWTREIFFVTSRFIRDGFHFYTLKDFSNEEIVGNFYQNELQKAIVNADTQYTVEKVVRKRKRNNETEVLVKWLGWGRKFNSWIPQSQLKGAPTT